MELRRVAPVVGLVALLAVDAALIAWAFRPTPHDTYVAVRVSRTSMLTPSAKPTSTATKTAKPAAAPAVKPEPIERYIAAVSPTVAWVASAGNCTNTGQVWVTGDGGANWTSGRLPGRVMRVRPTSATEAFATGGSSKACATLARWDTSNGGRDWGAPGDPTAAWSRMPEDATEVHTSLDKVQRPCGTRNVVDLSALDGKNAWVLCANGEVRQTTDGGQSWARRFTDKKSPTANAPAIKNPLAIAMAAGGKGVIATTNAQCDGVSVVPVVTGVPAADGTCVEGEVTPRRVSVSTSGDSWWLLMGWRVYSADDPGGPWTRTRADAAG